MSNPFLHTNNRFSLLSGESNNPFDNKKEKRTSKIVEDSNSKRENKFLKENTKYKRHIEPNIIKKVVEAPKEFNLEEAFPDINIKNKNENENENKIIETKFKDVVNQVIKVEKTTNVNTVKPGHIRIMDENGNPVFERGPLSKWEKKQLELEEYQKTPHYIMTTAINKMQTFWDLDEKLYDYLNGEGAYKEKYCLPPVYDSDEYNSDSEDYDSNDYDSDLDEY